MALNTPVEPARRPLHNQPGSLKLCCDSVTVVLPSRANANQSHADLPEKLIQKSIAGAALGAVVGRVIEFDGRHDERRISRIDDEIDMLLADAVGLAAVPIGIITGSNVGKSNLARDLITVGDKHFQDTKERRLIPGQQKASRAKDYWPLAGPVDLWPSP